MQVDNLFLESIIGKGSFGEVYLTRIKGDNNLYATKVYNRKLIENDVDLKKYLKSEVTILRKLNHPNIIKLKEVKKTKNHFYIVTEYYNGDNLMNTLENYKEKYGKPFSEEIVQYLMRQIMNGFNYLHSNNIMHRDIKLENILLNYQTIEDKNNLNIMKAIPKIIDFGLAIFLKNSLAESIIGNPINMSPLLLKKLTSNGKIQQLGYDKKEDIWSLGSICYEMLIGNPAFDADDLDDLVNKVERGNYKVPISLSKEVVSFINGMLQYDPKKRLTCEQLMHHKFLVENINNFHRIDLNLIPNKIEKNKFDINIKKNQSIWAIFNQEDQNKLMKINPEQINYISDMKENQNININKQKTLNPPKIINNEITNEQFIKTVNSFQTKDYSYYINSINTINNPVFGEIATNNYMNPQNYINDKSNNEINFFLNGGIYK